MTTEELKVEYKALKGTHYRGKADKLEEAIAKLKEEEKEVFLSKGAKTRLEQRDKGRIINCQKTGEEILPTDDFEIKDGIVIKI